MSRVARVDHRFVEFIPDELAPNTIYVSMEYGTALHACLCGCGQRVVTPITPTDWRLTYDGETISLHPSVGNWSFPCQSHYVIQGSRVIWAPEWSQDRIEAGRDWDRHRKDQYYSGARLPDSSDVATPANGSADRGPTASQAGRSVPRFVTAIARRLRRRD
jgi:Family of unknown function (DUF6527)